MALTSSEIQRIKIEMGYHGIGLGGSPYIDYLSAFEGVIQPYLLSGAITTCATTVAASAAPAVVTLTLADATGFAAGNRVVVDVDDAQETPVVDMVVGNTITVRLALAHSGTYPVTVEGAESIVRDYLRKILNVAKKQEAAAGRAGIKRVDEIEFFGSNATGGSSVFKDLAEQREYWRRELASSLGLTYLRGLMSGSSSRCEVY